MPRSLSARAPKCAPAADEHRSATSTAAKLRPHAASPGRSRMPNRLCATLIYKADLPADGRLRDPATPKILQLIRVHPRPGHVTILLSVSPRHPACYLSSSP
jgi:hypothetical protein